MYKLFKNENGILVNGVIRTTDGASIPFDEQNVDYQSYLAWCADGNEPTPAENT